MQEKEMFEPCTKHGQEKKYDCLECRLTVDSTPLFKKEEPQKESILAPRTECDHIVGFLSNNQDGGAAPIHQSDSMAKVLEASELLKYCPECGEKLNLK